jgi:DNA-binding NtrC family response regulator
LLRVVKSNPGEGSTFRVFIPALAKSHSTPDKPKRQKSLSIDTERILIIDDEPLLVQINKRLLEDYGYTVTVIGITDSREALEKVRAEPKQFDLIITDQTMPRLSGSEMAMAVLEIAPDMPIIICTGHSTVTSAEDAYAMGIKRYAYKPVDGDELVRTVRMVLDKQ